MAKTWGREAVSALVDIKPGAVAVVCAMPGGGKGRTARAAAEKWRRWVVYDPHARRDRTNWERGIRHRVPWPGVMVSPAQLGRCPGLLELSPLRLVVAPERFNRKAFPVQAAGLMRMAWHQGGGLVLVLEEAALYAREAADTILELASGGAHADLSLVFVVQSIGRIPKDARRHISLVIAGPQNEPSDVEDLSQRCGVGFARRVRALREGDEPLVWRPGDAFRESEE